MRDYKLQLTIEGDFKNLSKIDFERIDKILEDERIKIKDKLIKETKSEEANISLNYKFIESEEDIIITEENLINEILPGNDSNEIEPDSEIEKITPNTE